MRFVVYGAGAVGGVVGARLHQHGQEVVLIARGAHYEAVRDGGLRVECGEEPVRVEMPVVDHPRAIGFLEDDVVLLAVKTQDTAPAVRALADCAPPGTPIVCMQNSVENERLALRLFANVYGVVVMCPTAHLRPGVVQAFSTPTTGILDIGRYPEGVDGPAEAVAGIFEASAFVSEPRPDIMRWKYRKLIMNLGNAVQAVCGPEAGFGVLARRAAEEGAACLRAAGIDFVSQEDDAARRGDHLRLAPAGAERWRGGSSWQSLARGTGTIEADYLNGEIVLLGRLHGVPTPVNALLARLANEMAGAAAPPGSLSEDEVLARLSKG